jgi:hypothetical protein
MRAPQRRASSSSLENTLGSQLSRTAPSIWSMSPVENHERNGGVLIVAEEGHRRPVVVGSRFDAVSITAKT